MNIDKKKKAVRYCRVSTDEECQLNALEKQIQECEDEIISNGWELVDSYIDESKSGTTSKHRNEYNRLLHDLSSDKFDIIVIKSQDRLMRNVKDWYIFIDTLITNNKKLYFYLEHKFYTPDDSLITGIKAILSEEYSRDLSKKIVNMHKKRQAKNGKPIITSSTWGYDNVNKTIVINVKEAEVIKTIFSLACEGYGSRTISKKLYNMGIYSRRGGQFPDITIRKIIRNPIYKGLQIMNRYHIDFNTKKNIPQPKEDWLINKDSIPRIISDEIWEKANLLMDKRSIENNIVNSSNKRIGINIGSHILSGKIICGECGSVYWRKSRKLKGNNIIDWYCREYIRYGRKTNDTKRGKYKIKENYIDKKHGCDNIHIKETDLEEALISVYKNMFIDRKQEIIDKFISIASKYLTSNNNIKETINNNISIIETLNNQRSKILDKLLDGTIPDDIYKKRDNELVIKINSLTKDNEELNKKEETLLSTEKRINLIRKELENIDLSSASVSMLESHITNIIINRNKIDIHFDFFDDISLDIKNNGKKKNLFVITGEQLIPQTEIYQNIKPRELFNICINF